jgi:hypothetical protein
MIFSIFFYRNSQRIWYNIFHPIQFERIKFGIVLPHTTWLQDIAAISIELKKCTIHLCGQVCGLKIQCSHLAPAIPKNLKWIKFFWARSLVGRHLGLGLSLGLGLDLGLDLGLGLRLGLGLGLASA